MAKPESASKDLGGSIQSRVAAERERAVERLGEQPTLAAYRQIVGCARDPNPGVRARVAEALRLHQRRGVAGVLMRLLRDKDDVVRINAAESLGLLRARSAIRSLQRSLRIDSEELVRAYAAEALGRVGDVRVISFLERYLLRDRSSAVRLRILTALHTLGARSRLDEIIEFLNDADYHVRCAVAVSLEELASPSTRGAIRKAMQRQLKVEPTIAVKERLKEVLGEL